MRIHLIAVGQRMPAWVEVGFEEFAKRLPHECSLNLIELAAGKRGKGADIARAIQDEGQRMLDAVPKNTMVVALDQRGKEWDTEELSRNLSDWLQDGRDIALLVGGPDGLAPECVQLAERKWSLSKLTLPHPMVRIVLAEQLYRAWSILKNHPYHR
ncbi:MAG: 23S rRNA (pseudouridine(1915)-N(3))-methyltransferase RlmH [Gammaproteobacteria bacterium]|nr:23S rRNA (pseudouridine(1915)-N(3))-methyltransferase RlmH [Gammaproteobacteria bacterium]